MNTKINGAEVVAEKNINEIIFPISVPGHRSPVRYTYIGKSRVRDFPLYLRLFKSC